MTLLEGDGIALEVAHHDGPSKFAIRNVFADEVHFILQGSARLECDFGTLDVVSGDFIHIPRAVSYRFGEIEEPVVDVVIGVDSQLLLRPDNPPGTLNVVRDADQPRPWDAGQVSSTSTGWSSATASRPPSTCSDTTRCCRWRAVVQPWFSGSTSPMSMP